MKLSKYGARTKVKKNIRVKTPKKNLIVDTQ